MILSGDALCRRLQLQRIDTAISFATSFWDALRRTSNACVGLRQIARFFVITGRFGYNEECICSLNLLILLGLDSWHDKLLGRCLSELFIHEFLTISKLILTLFLNSFYQILILGGELRINTFFVPDVYDLFAVLIEFR